ncbi:MAG: VWA domain-containing protein [Planctomycetota bacterium]
MNLLNPTAIAIAAGLTIPPLIALYFLKLKRAVRLVPSTLLWKRAVEDLRVNAPFQRLRRSLLLLLQLLVLILAAIALGKPMFEMADVHEDTIIILIDQSASMDVMERDGRTRLDRAKELAKLRVDNMGDDARAMVIAFCDRATVVSSFDTDIRALKRKIDSIEQTQSTSSLVEAVELAEAYAQNVVIASDEAGSDIAPESPAPTATVFLFTDGRIGDVENVALQEFDLDNIHVANVGQRGDNVGILAMQARRNYERPEILEVTATIQNFGSEAASFDAILYVDGQNVDVQSIELAPGENQDATSIRDATGSRDATVRERNPTRPSGPLPDPPRADVSEPPPGSLAVASFDEVVFEGGGVVKVVLRLDDALSADDRAWTIIEHPRHIRVLLVTPGNLFLQNALDSMPFELVTMTGEAYEDAEDREIVDGKRSAFDLVILDRHSTARLPQGNYFFWGSVPKIDGVSADGVINDQIIFNWDDTHPILRHVAVETVFVYEWLRLSVPPEAVSIIDGETTAVMTYFTRNASQFLISAFSLIVEDETGNAVMNTYWPTSVDFVVFMQNAVQYLAANVAAVGKKCVSPGEPVTLPIPERVEEVRVVRPDALVDRTPSGGYQTIHYARTRQVGVFRVEPGVVGEDQFAVNLFDPGESRVAPAPTLTLGAARVESEAGVVRVNQPAWRHFLLAVLALLILEWIVYNHRVFV